MISELEREIKELQDEIDKQLAQQNMEIEDAMRALEADLTHKWKESEVLKALYDNNEVLILEGFSCVYYPMKSESISRVIRSKDMISEAGLLLGTYSPSLSP